MKISYLILSFCLITLTSFSQVQDSSLVLKKYAHLSPNTMVHKILVDKKNRKILATSTGIYVISNENMKPEKVTNNPTISICLNKRNEIIGLYPDKVVNWGNNQKISLDNSAAYNSIQVLNNTIWIGSNKGLFAVNQKTGTVKKQYTKRNSKLPNNQINFLFIDKEKSLWVGTDSGIAIYNSEKERWKVYEKGQKMEAMAYNKEGLWLVSDQDMYLIDPFGRWYPTDADNGLRQGVVRDITTDADGRLIMASESIVRYNPYKEEIFSYSESLSFLSKKTSTVEGDLNNVIWIGTQGDGLYILSFSDTRVPMLNAIVEETKSITCDDKASAKLELKVFGGKTPYKYLWSTGSKAKSINHLKAGSYDVTITDANKNNFETNYIIVDAYPIEINVIETLQVSSTNNNDGLARIAITGGHAPYKIMWPDGESESLVNNKLSQGLHEIKVVDNKNCSETIDINIPRSKFIPDLVMDKITVGQTLQIKDLNFEADSSYINRSSETILDEVYQFLNKNEEVVIEIGGHTNNIPPKEYCYKLSSARAKNVALYLVEQGISKDRIHYKGYGKDKPIADNNTSSGRKKNQRVEIKILEIN